MLHSFRDWNSTEYTMADIILCRFMTMSTDVHQLVVQSKNLDHFIIVHKLICVKCTATLCTDTLTISFNSSNEVSPGFHPSGAGLLPTCKACRRWWPKSYFVMDSLYNLYKWWTIINWVLQTKFLQYFIQTAILFLSEAKSFKTSRYSNPFEVSNLVGVVYCCAETLVIHSYPLCCLHCEWS